MCLRELLKRDAKWKYYMNPAASELPLVTVEEMENTLRSIGDNIAESYTFPPGNVNRLQEHPLPWRTGPNQYDLNVEFRPRRDEPPPYGLVVRKGEKNVAITREFAEFCIHSRVAIELVNWLQSLFFSDELFYSTLVTIKSINDQVRLVKMVCAWLGEFCPALSYALWLAHPGSCSASLVT